ncbi:MAG TPA: tetratricopeptide repeat protein, partial [bacterium]|nr:tetratricopeptide repeat protein [bacterium]
QYQMGLYSESLQQTRRLLTLAPGERVAEIRVALCLFQLGNLDKAREEFEALLAKYPGSYEVRAGLGSCLVHKARSADQQDRDVLLKRAEEEISQSLQIRPGSLEGLLALAEVQFLSGQIQEASSTAAQVIALDAESTFAADLMGQAAMELGAYAQAEEFFNQALRFRRNTTPTVSAMIRDHLGVAGYCQNKLQVSYDEWNRANQIDPSYHPSYDNNACLAMLRQKNNRSIELLTTGMQLLGFGSTTEISSSAVPSFQQKTNLLLRSACARLRLEQYNDAASILEQLTRLAADQPFGFFELGNVQYLRGRREDSVRAYEQAWSLAVDVPVVGYNFGSLLLEQGSYTRSQEVLSRVVQIDPSNLDAHLNLGDALLNARNVKGASEQFQKASEIDTGNALPLIRMGQTMELVGDLRRAEQAYLKGITLDPSNGRTYFFLGLLRRRLSGTDSLAQAEKDLAKAIELEPSNDTARTELGYVFLKANKLMEAEEQFKTVLENPLYASYDKAYNGLG